MSWQLLVCSGSIATNVFGLREVNPFLSEGNKNNALSGFVKLNIKMETKIMGGVPEKLHTNYPSRFEIEEKVTLVFGDDRIVKDCKIDAVRFTEGKVRYDLAVPLWTPKEGEEQRYTYIENVDSVCVQDAE